MLINVQWSDVKSFAQARSLSLQWVIANNIYFISGIDGSTELTCQIPLDNSEDQLDFETNFKANGNKILVPKDTAGLPLSGNNPFSSKTLPGHKLYFRGTGSQYSLNAGSNILSYVIPYNWVKFTGIEVINAESLDQISVSILDTATGTYSSVPNYNLNQFAFSINVGPGQWRYETPYDADLYQGVVVSITYTSVSAKTLGINFIFNQVV